MLGKIIAIEENLISVKLNVDVYSSQNIIGLHVGIDDHGRNCVGEISDIKDGIAFIQLLGEFIDGKFIFGVSNKPSFASKIDFLSHNKVASVISIAEYKEDKHLYIGRSPIYENINISVDINDLFSNHFAIFGSTGSGKSCSVARIFQNLFTKKEYVPYKASIFMFDAYGEYHNAFKDINMVSPNIHFKAYTTDVNSKTIPILKIPVWLLSADDLAILLGVTKNTQIPFIEKALKLVTVFAKEESEVIKTKNDIIARAALDILSSGRPSSQVRDQIVSVLSHFNTSELNLETPVYQPGYTRPLKQCLLIDASGKMRDIELLTNFIEGFLVDDIELFMPDGTFKYSLKDLYDAFEFALISEGSLMNERIYDEANSLKVRLNNLLTGDYGRYFECEEFMTREEYIRSLMTIGQNRKAQIINFNINYVDDRFAKAVTKIFSKMLFDYCKDKDEDERHKLPIHIILEEAHRYVQNDNDIEFLGYNIFERITKEGRKYGILLGLISQRPSELSETTLSQCNNFLIFKLLHPRDTQYIKDMVPNVTNEILKRIKILQPGNCMAFGNAFKVPVLIRLDMPNPRPSSSSCDVSEAWFVRNNN